MFDYALAIAVYLIALNLIAFISFWYDKWMAGIRGWRTHEKTLLMLMASGGSIGGVIAMVLFHHKTRKISFLFPVVIIILVQVGLTVLLFDTPM